MSRSFPLPKPDINRFEQRVGELRQALRTQPPARLAERTGAAYRPLDHDQGEFHLALWGQPVRLSFPALSATPGHSEVELPVFQLALLLYYFVTADGAPLGGQWISFAELPDGRFYNQAFQGYSGQELARCYANDLPGFVLAAQSLGGERQPLGDASFSFLALPRVPVLVVYWQGDEDFPASCQVLFDSSASHYLPSDAYAILGSTLTGRLIKAKGASENA